MTLDELIFELTAQRDATGRGDLEVRMSQPSHDYWRTQLAVAVDRCEVAYTVWSDYHSEHRLTDRTEDEEQAADHPCLMLS